MPIPRFRIRTLMIAVAVVAVGLGAASWIATMRARSAAYQQRASELQWSMARTGSITALPDGKQVDIYEDENDRRHDEWAARLEAKYLRLSHYPWLVADPDPAPPEPLAHARSAFDLPERKYELLMPEADGAFRIPEFDSPPAWTFLWTWR